MTITDIYDFLIYSQGVNRIKLTPDVDLCCELGIDGDDFFELEEEFAEKFSVNMDGYRWYFHHEEEGWNIGALISPAPYQQVEHIPVTPSLLLNAAQTGKWPLEYPNHTPKRRKLEASINYLIPLIIIILMALVAIKFNQ